MVIDSFVTSLHRQRMRRLAYVRWAALVPAALLLSGCAVLNKRELTPTPPMLTHAQLVHAANDEELVGTNLQLAIEGRQIQAAKNHLKKLELLGKTFEVRALGLGLKACAKG